MADVFVVGYDGSESAKRAVDFAAGRAKSSMGEVVVVRVLEWSPFSFHTPEELAERHKRREEELARAAKLVDPVVASLKKSGVNASSHVGHGHAGDILSQIAMDKKAAAIIIGRTGDSSFTQRFLGGLALTLVQGAPVPVTVVP